MHWVFETQDQEYLNWLSFLLELLVLHEPPFWAIYDFLSIYSLSNSFQTIQLTVAEFKEMNFIND